MEISIIFFSLRMLRFLLAIFLILSSAHGYRVERMVQSTAIRGKFICGQKPAIGVRVKLFEQDQSLLNSYTQPIITDGYMLGNYFTITYFRFILKLNLE